MPQSTSRAARWRMRGNDLLLIMVALIWGSGFVAQKIGADRIGPNLFNGLRFLLGALVVLPFYLRRLHQGELARHETAERNYIIQVIDPGRLPPAAAAKTSHTFLFSLKP